MKDLFDIGADLFHEDYDDLFPTFNPPTKEKEEKDEHKEEGEQEGRS